MTNALRLFVVAALAAAASAEFVSGTASSEVGFKYLAKFCFDYTPRPPYPGFSDGSTMTLQIRMKVSIDSIPTDMRLYVFDDQPSSWPAVYQKDISCAEKISRSRNSTSINFNPFTGDWEMPLARIHEHVRPRFWYIVAANCRSFEDIYYEVRFKNQGGSWVNEFGVNEQHLNTIYLTFFLVWGVGLVLHGYAIRNMWGESSLHPIIKLLTSVIVFQFLSVFAGLIHYSVFMSNGSGVPMMKAVQEVFQVLAHLTFMFMLIMVAQGWTISNDRIEHRGFIFGFFLIVIGCYVALVLWNVAGRDPASTLYPYESVPGVLIVLMDLVCGCWFVYLIWQTHKVEQDEEKQRFYEYIALGYFLYFITLPATVATAAALDPWVREKVVVAISLTVSTIAYGSMAALLWPSRADKYFRISVPDTLGADDDTL